MVTAIDIYGGADPREVPNYSIPEAARYLRVPEATLRAWVRGTTYGAGSAKTSFEPLLALQGDSRLLTFTNLVEAHVLNAIRRQHGIPMQRVRRALQYLYDESVASPLAGQQFETDGIDLFVERCGTLVNATRSGQVALRALLQAHLRRIERDENGLAARLFPFVLQDLEHDPGHVQIDPRISFGKPTLVGSGVPTEAIADRFAAGESITELAEDYDRPVEQIESAIRYERAA